MRIQKGYFYKIKRGYNKDDEIKIEGSDVQKAIIGFITGDPISLNGMIVSGKTITSIEPDYNEILCFRDDAHIDGDSMAYLKRSGILDNHRDYLDENTRIAQYLIENKMKSFVGKFDTLEELQANSLNQINAPHNIISR
jgi:hypothetical protein